MILDKRSSTTKMVDLPEEGGRRVMKSIVRFSQIRYWINNGWRVPEGLMVSDFVD